ncbi:MAG: HD domain-containing protein [Candidatus Aenigmatarchaeota archaeon]
MEIKNKQIPDYKKGDAVNDLFAVRFKKPIRQTKNGKYFFEIKFQDAKGETMFKYWGRDDREKIQGIYDSIHADDVVKVIKGVVGEFNNTIDISINEGEGEINVLQPGEYDVRGFVDISNRNPDEMMRELRSMFDSISDVDLKAVVEAFFEDNDFVEKFKTSPAAMYKHHGCVSGLLEHTLNVANICNDISKHHPKLNKNLLLVGAFIHDIGKIDEFNTTTQIKVSDKGNLLGHISLGIQMLTRKLDSLDISDSTKDKLLHMLVSHHGKLEFGSPKMPSFPEALLLHKADELDAFVTQMIEYKENANTEDSFVYSKDFGNIYLK